MIRSLVVRLTLLEQLTVVAAILAFGVIAWVVTAHILDSEHHRTVGALAAQFAAGFDDELAEDPDSVVAAQGVVEDAILAGVDVELRTPAGRLLASSRERRVARSPGRPADSVRAEASFVAQARARSGVTVTVALSNKAERRTLSALWRSLVIASLPILLLSLLLGRAIASRALQPLSTMAALATDLSIERNPRSLGSRSGLAELDRLAGSFDRLLERLDDAMRSERRLTADASHELRTPLTVLSGELELLLERAPVASAEALGLARAQEHVGAMRELIDAILLLHRSGQSGIGASGEFEVINLGDLCRETLAEMRRRHPGREPDLTFHTPDEALVNGHGTLLASAVRNLFDNALKFTRSGQPVEVAVSVSGGEARVTVDDHGPGIRDDERERIFDPFFRGAEARAGGSGFGLGLPILRRVARLHGGEVDVAHSPLGGARFTLRLPLR